MSKTANILMIIAGTFLAMMWLVFTIMFRYGIESTGVTFVSYIVAIVFFILIAMVGIKDKNKSKK